MKTKFTLVVALVVAFFAANAQTSITNGGLETWSGTPSAPTGWSTMDNLLASFGEMNTKFVTKDSATNKIQGTYSAKLVVDTSSAASRLLPGVLNIGAVSYGGPTVGIVFKGIPFTSRPDSLHFAFKAQPVTGDTAAFSYSLTKWNSTGDSVDFIGGIPPQYLVFLPQAGNNFLNATLPFDYVSGASPDSLYLYFLPGFRTKKNSALWIDDVSLIYNGSTDVEDLSLNTTVSLFPVPASNDLNIQVKDNMLGQRYEIYNLAGELMTNGLISKNIQSVDVSNFAAGTYLFSSTSANGKVSTGRFSVVK